MRFHVREQAALVASLLKWCVLGAAVGVLSGAASAAFLAGLARATEARESSPRLLWFLPAAGVFIGWVYARFGKDVEGGNNLLLDRIHGDEGDVSWRMAPLIALSTIGTHLFGGSAGREGTAVQMGGSLADGLARWLKLSRVDRRMLLMGGISGGFGSVFGTPLAGTVFGLEVLAIGRIRYDALVPCFVASTVGDLVCRGLGVGHHAYEVGALPRVTPGLLLWVAAAGLLFGATSLAFAELTHAVQHAAKSLVRVPWLRPFFGGLAVIGLTYAVGNRDYLGLGLPLIEASFTTGGVFLGAFALKLLFTAVTLGTGFKGGEVTPLFCIGATLGYAFARLTGQPTSTFAALGFVAVFAGAANTPLACVLMGIELFGAGLAVPLTLACVVSYIASGHRGIYLSQRVDTPKASAVAVPDGVILRDVREVLTVGRSHRDVGRGDFEARDRGERMENDTATFGARPCGQLRIFLRSGDRPRTSGWWERLHAKPTYQTLLHEARRFGLTHGTVKHCASGFMAEGHVEHDHFEYGNPRLPLYVELLGPREALEAFCHASAERLRGRFMVYKDIEQWGWGEAAAGRADGDAT